MIFEAGPKRFSRRAAQNRKTDKAKHGNTEQCVSTDFAPGFVAAPMFFLHQMGLINSRHDREGGCEHAFSERLGFIGKTRDQPAEKPRNAHAAEKEVRDESNNNDGHKNLHDDLDDII